MKTIYYSELLNRQFATEEECLAAEKLYEEEVIDSDNELDDRDKVRQLYWRLMRVAKRDKKVEEMIGDSAEKRIRYLMDDWVDNPEKKVIEIIRTERIREPAPQVADNVYKTQNSRTKAEMARTKSRIDALSREYSRIKSSK